MTASRQSQLMKEAMQHMPQGVAENYRYWGDDRTVFVAHSKGCEITDCDLSLIHISEPTRPY